MRIKIIVLLMISLLVVSLAGCGANTDNNESNDKSNTESTSTSETVINNDSVATVAMEEEITLRLEQFSGRDGNEDALKKMIAEFNVIYPNITVDLQSFGYDDYFTQLQTKVVGGNAADVFELNFENFVAYASEGVLMDIGGMLGDTSGFNQTALNAFNYQGKQYGVPNSFSNVLLVYNKDLFDRAGIAYPTDTWTWTEMLTAAKAIRALDNNIFGLFRPISFHEFYKGVKQNGGSLMTDDMKEFTVNLRQNIETLETMISWVNEHNVMPNDAQLGGMPNEDLFRAGRLGMIVIGTWMINDFIENCDFAWDITVEPGNTSKATHFFANSYVVNSETKHSEAAAALASFLAGSREATSIRVEASWELPPVIYDDILAAYLSKTPPENRAAVFDSLNYLCTPPVVKQQSEMQDIIAKHLGNALSGSMNAKDALDACQEELETKINFD